MDYLLLRFGYPPIHIPYENCNAYFDVLNQTDKELRPFMRVLHNYLMETMNQVLLKKNWVDKGMLSLDFIGNISYKMLNKRDYELAVKE